MARRRASKGSQRPTEKERRYRKLLREQERSGLSQAEFARQQGISPSSLGWWKHEIARRERAREQSLPDAGPPLLPVRIAGASEAGGVLDRGAGRLEVQLARSGHTIRVPAVFDPGQLAALVQTLEVVPC